MKDADTELRHRLGDDPATWKPSMRMIGAGHDPPGGAAHPHPDALIVGRAAPGVR
jgi:hypothetical protein